MSKLKDLTRWNRAGLIHFDYINGNAIEYLEILRQKMFEQFRKIDPESKLETCKWLSPAEKIPSNEREPEGYESLIERQERLSVRQTRLQEMYYQDRRDWAWEITRAFSRACHILTEYSNAYANEGYLGTATQWDNVRRLVGLLDYQPAPPASATTPLILIAKENKAGTVAKGFQVKNAPPQGGNKVFFETLQDIEIDSALNELRPSGWNQSEDPVVPEDAEITTQNPGSDKAEFAAIVYEKATSIRGVKEEGAGNAYELVKNIRIIDILQLDPDSTALDNHNTALLWEWQAKADILLDFAPKGDWSEIESKKLSAIASASSEYLAEQSGNSLEFASELKLEIEKVEYALAPENFATTCSQDLFQPNEYESGSALTDWKAKDKRKPKPGEIAMICRVLNDSDGKQYVKEVNAATVAGVENKTSFIRLQPSAVSKDWLNWTKGESRLKLSPRWKRDSWLNGDDVIRTEEPHGLTADTYISWKIDYVLEVGESLASKGRSLVSIAIDEHRDKLSIRIFDDNGKAVINKNNQPENREAFLISDRAIEYLRKLDPNLDVAALSDDKQQKIIDKAMECAMFTPWKHGKIIETDKWSLRLEVKGAIPQPGQEIYVLRPIEKQEFPANHDAVVLVGGNEEVPPMSEKVAPSAESPAAKKEPLFCLRNVITDQMEPFPEEPPAGGGGGLLPPASLPEIGTFLFPSPMLPMDLVKAAVELLLSFGVMVIPSTGEIVIKGMPFGGMLEGMTTPAQAADALFNMLDSLIAVVQEQNDDCEPLWDNGTADGTPDNPTGLLPPLFQKDGEVAVPKKVVQWKKTIFTDIYSDIIDGAYKELPVEAKEAAIERDKAEAIKAALEEMLTIPEGKEATALFQQLIEDITDKGPLLTIPKEPVAKAVVKAIEYPYMFTGTSKIDVGDWVVADFSDGVRALQVDTINWYTDSDKTDSFSLEFATKKNSQKELRKVYHDFREELVAEGADVNTTDVDPNNITLESLPDSLREGDDVFLAAEGKEPILAKIDQINGNAITTVPAATGYTKGKLIIRGNVVMAGHGELNQVKIIGSGNAALTNQEFVLEVEGISFIPDATMRTGVAAAVDVEVDGSIWKQVSTLKDSAPDDHHYNIRMTEDGFLKIIFGDSENGRRLPTGKNNIKVQYRVGSGTAGNVVETSLVKPVKPHPLIDSVLQPLQAGGGGDMEDITSLRENAPPSVLALQRAVSISDFSHLAASQSSVWQAKAYDQVLHEARMENVKVVIVPAGGVYTETVTKDIKKFLQKHALPNVWVSVENFHSQLFNLNVIVRIRTEAFKASYIVQAVTEAIKEHFKLKNRKLGAHLYLSEVYKVVESIKGVENSVCVLNDNASLKIINARDDNSVIHLDTEARQRPSRLYVTTEKYRP